MIPQYARMNADVTGGFLAYDIWGRLGWRETRRRYRRTTFGPLWSTLSLSIFVAIMGVVWSRLWHQDLTTYLPFLTSGMICWLMFSSIVIEGCGILTSGAGLITQIPISYTLLACASVWRNAIMFGHNLIIYALVFIYSGLSFSWAMLLVIPGLILLALNGVWISLLFGLATARFRDVQQLVMSILQVSMFITPIFWAPDQLHGRIRALVDYNLLYQYIQIVRGPMMGQVPTAWTWLFVIAATVLGWALVFYLYAHFRRRIPFWL
jgi:ABC-type polysaccharide/polyol phosphate export permease